MPDTPKPARPWRVVAEEASREFDPGKMADLMRELSQALDEQNVVEADGERKPTQAPHKKSA